MEVQIKMTMKYLICLVLWLKSKTLRTQILARMWRKRNSHFIAMGNEKIIVTVEKQGEKCQSGKVILHIIPSV